MAKQQTILLGGWAAFSEARGLTKKEEPETFRWMSEDEAFWYGDMRAALDATPGAREFLRSLKPDDSHRNPVIDALQDKMSSSHSGASMSCLIGSYRAALHDWDAWVLATKNRELLGEYKKKQIELTPLIIFYNHLTCIGPAVTDEAGFKAAMENANVVFSDKTVTWDNGAALDTVKALLNEMRAMKAEEDAKWKARRLKERMEYLEWNFKHPSRWFWPGEQHPRYSITQEEIAEMERVHPGYRAHIDLVCDHINHMGCRAGVQQSPENNASHIKRLEGLGIMRAAA